MFFNKSSILEFLTMIRGNMYSTRMNIFKVAKDADKNGHPFSQAFYAAPIARQKLHPLPIQP